MHSERTTKPFARALSDLLAEQEISQREVARRTQSKAGRLNRNAISLLCRGDLQPSLEAMELIAAALAIRPEFFAEYRLAKRRDELDWKRHGLRKALRALGE